jgi:hypothetical protein
VRRFIHIDEETIETTMAGTDGDTNEGDVSLSISGYLNRG